MLLKNPENQKIQMISRGDVKGEVGNYLKEAARRCFSSSTSIEKTRPVLNENTGIQPVIECPLLFKNEQVGLLCAGTERAYRQEIEENLAFLHTLSILAGISLRMLSENQNNLIADRINTLHRVIEQYDAQAYSLTLEEERVAGEFMARIAMPENVAEDVLTACKLSYYSPDFIKEAFPGCTFPAILEEGRNLIDDDSSLKWENTSIGSQIFALVVLFVRENGSLEWLSFNQGEGGILQKFVSFIKERQVAEQEFSLEQDSKPSVLSVSSTIKNEMNLSPREQEVLDLVIQGLNNKEIAQELFISEHTVKNHLTKVFQKLDVTDRGHAISKVYQMTYEKSNLS